MFCKISIKHWSKNDPIRSKAAATKTAPRIHDQFIKCIRSWLVVTPTGKKVYYIGVVCLFFIQWMSIRKKKKHIPDFSTIKAKLLMAFSFCWQAIAWAALVSRLNCSHWAGLTSSILMPSGWVMHEHLIYRERIKKKILLYTKTLNLMLGLFCNRDRAMVNKTPPDGADWFHSVVSVWCADSGCLAV